MTDTAATNSPAASSKRFAFLVAAMQHDHYLEIMLPGFVTGAIIGFLTQTMGSPRWRRADGASLPQSK